MPPSPLPMRDARDGYCPVAAGPFAFSTLVPWNEEHALTTVNTRIRAVDPLGSEILCLDAATTPLNPGHGSVYGQANYIFWGSVGLAIAYWVVVGIARVIGAWGRGASRPGPGMWPKVESAGFILASAISGERLATSPALMRFGKWAPLSADDFFLTTVFRYPIHARHHLPHSMVRCPRHGCCRVAELCLYVFVSPAIPHALIRPVRSSSGANRVVHTSL